MRASQAPNMRGKRVRIVVADDDLGVLEMANQLLQPEFEVVEMVSNGRALVAAAVRLRPDVVVADISMPVLSGIEALRQIRSRMPEIKFVFFTMHDAAEYRKEAHKAGAAGYVLKSSAREDLNQTIRGAVEGPG
ncbi:MAG TPA: response regulator transcription factor [Bryobacteraceae bacterium]|nr:response regulator transcription factor [Bryobacteraceae bacterium]